jgi:hypothetical protein
MHPFLPYEIADVHAQRLREELARDRRFGARRRSRFGRSGRRSGVEEAIAGVVERDDFADVELGGEVDVRGEPLGDDFPAPDTSPQPVAQAVPGGAAGGGDCLAPPSPCGTTGSSG